MKIFCRWIAVVGGLSIPAATALTALVMSSCGGDDTGPAETDSGSGDSTLEAAPDVANQEASPDVSSDGLAAPDSTVAGGLDGSIDGSLSDADSGSTSTEAEAPDAEAGIIASDASDAGADAVTDAANDVMDATSEVVDLSTLYAFPGQVATALCQQTALCCFPDASTRFNVGQCSTDFSQLGFYGSNEGTAYLDGGNVALDPSKAKACLDDITAIDCRTNQLTSADMLALYQDCFGAMTGTLPTGASCQASIECAPGTFCDTPDGGAQKTCQSVRSSGASCGDFGTPMYPSSALGNAAQSTCSNRGSGNTGLACEFYSPGTFVQPDGGWFCRPAQGSGAPCSQNLDCTTKLCTDGLTCGQATAFAAAGGCAAYRNPDGG